MLNEEKLDDVFAQFLQSGSGSDDIKQIYETLPYLNKDQQRIITLYRSLAVKYNSAVLHEIADTIERHASKNRHAGWSFTKRLEANALYKHFQGYRATGNMNEAGQAK